MPHNALFLFEFQYQFSSVLEADNIDALTVC